MVVALELVSQQTSVSLGRALPVERGGQQQQLDREEQPGQPLGASSREEQAGWLPAGKLE